MLLNFFRFITLFAAVSFCGLGLFIYSHSKNLSSRQHRTLCSFLLVTGLWSFGFFLTMFKSLPYEFALAASRTSHFFGGLTGITYLSFVVSFLETERKTKVRLFDSSFAIFNAVMCFTPWMIKELPAKMFFPYYPEPGVLYPLYIVNFVSPFAIAYVLLYKAYRCHAVSQIQRQHILMALWGVLIGWTGVSALFLLIYNIQIAPTLLILLPAIFIFFAYSIVRYRFLDIEVVIRRGLVYSLLVACITVVYLVMVLLIERFFQGMMGYRSVAGTIVVSFLVAVFFNPLRSCIQSLVDKAIFQGTPDELATQREQLLAEIRRTEQMRAVNILAASLAHEIKNPLTSIKTFTEHLNTKYDDPSFRNKFQMIVGGEVERINHIVHQLLEYAKPQPPQLVCIRVDSLIRETLELMSSELFKRQVRLSCSIDDALTVQGDAKQLKQVLLNLIVNALDAMEKPGQLYVAASSKDNKIEITLRDTGKGIPSDQLPHIFELFFTSKPHGTGLGLAVVRTIIDEHGGEISISSEQGKGT